MSMNSSQEKQQYDEAFGQVLAQLDAWQRRAVDQIEGPVAVIAGPGAGKTHIMAARIGRILRDTDAKANNILCLTFTDAGVLALRSRLLQLIGPEAHRVHIFTFHSFCNSIIQDNLDLFGRRDLEPVSELERIEITRRLLESLAPDHPLRQGHTDPHLYEQQLRELFRLMKSEDWKPEFVSMSIDAWLADLPQRSEYQYARSGKGFKKGDPKKALLQTASERMARLRAAAQLYPAYESAMRAARRYDYDDMILWVLRAFETNETLLRNYQEQYLYFMVDEYQDTNGAQNEVLLQLARYWEEPNLFIVGDDDQSVYEFQGARLQNLTEFLESYRNSVELIVLPNNYRSSQHILDAAAGVIQHNQLRVVHQFPELRIEKKLVAANPAVAALPQLPEWVVYPNRLHEIIDIARQIETWRDEGVPLSEIAVIYARHRQAEALQALLERRGIPCQTKRKTDILKLPMLRHWLEWLRYIETELRDPGSGEYYLFRLLHFHFTELPAAEINRLHLYLAAQSPAVPRRTALSDVALLQAAGIRETEPFLRLSRSIDELMHSLANDTLPAFLERALNRSGLLAWILRQPDAVQLLEVMRTFFDFAELETLRRPQLSLMGLLSILDSFETNGVPIELQHNAVAGKGVQLVTAHSAKGLEFERVFVLDAVKEEWEPRKRSGGGRFALPDTLTRSAEEDALEARRRLFYVAMTRAKTWLQVSYSMAGNAGKPLQAAVFVDELLEHSGREARQQTLSAEQIAPGMAAMLSEAPPQIAEAPPLDIIAPLLEGFAMSITALNRYLRCPLEFYYQHILRAPAPATARAAYGTAMHFAVQRFFERMLADREKVFPDLATLRHFFETEMRRLQGRFTPSQWEHYTNTGHSRLEALHRQEDWRRHRDVKVEYTVRRTHLEGVPMTGTIDKIEFYDQLLVSVVDYKTGKPDAAKLAPPSSKNPYGTPYWRQLAFYKLLYEHFDQSSRLVREGAITFLDPDAEGRFVTLRTSFDSHDMAMLKELIENTYARIMQQDFYTGCGKSDCLWCNFLRHNAQTETFTAPEIEDLDDAR
ncbi:MAG: ATP-dependent helicase [Saprospiraceae bacterium]|nr:ATP-dependent helicase [Saprospiraceae bacterium]HRD82458.1 ATP-dependent DNA helicase [Saprospiraceae bacterium]